jgi:cytochrome bd ubiquinol oxidase subunit II
VGQPHRVRAAGRGGLWGGIWWPDGPTLIALGVIARGAAFAFRKAVTEPWQQRIFGAAFAFSSLVTPFFLGAAAGGAASGQCRPGWLAGT